MTLSDQLATDATLVFANTSDFAEAVTYKPFTYNGQTSRANRSINAVVVRQSREVLTQDGEHAIELFEVHVANDSTTGISSSELDLGKDKLAFAPRLGETVKDFTIFRLIEHDAGMLVIECR